MWENFFFGEIIKRWRSLFYFLFFGERIKRWGSLFVVKRQLSCWFEVDASWRGALNAL